VENSFITISRNLARCQNVETVRSNCTVSHLHDPWRERDCQSDTRPSHALTEDLVVTSVSENELFAHSSLRSRRSSSRFWKLRLLPRRLHKFWSRDEPECWHCDDDELCVVTVLAVRLFWLDYKLNVLPALYFSCQQIEQHISFVNLNLCCTGSTVIVWGSD